ncbi:sigma-70 family RNA polymerase sigma factor [Oscillibacter sp. 1-3]|uniref:sigma-70 family RNA polymerase sigma factor n=1 Tax=Oscillibacter sp. 1-3 TaxID=1235797 RepID=UPI00033B4694|nr:sigma-70 family RNA polymerase sigma factor [Oscillibacter sp. 1-3]EOS66636.1 sigma-70 family RNA polymerase sigma factor [Oscillibacter sp. 1-3]
MNTNKNIEAYVVNILESYPKRELQISLLHYEMQHTAHISPEEMIEGMSFAHGDSTGGRKGRISDKTMYIALNYQERMDRMNEDAANKIARRLLELESEQDRIRYYVSLLEKRESVVIRLTYFEGLSQEAVAESLGIVSRTMRRIKKRAIEKLAKMYGFAENPKR